MKNEKKGLFSLMSRIDGMSNQFTKTDWKIVQFMKNSPQEFLAGSAQNLATKINVSDASIVRFAQKVGFSGLSELKYTLQNELDKESTIISHNAYTLLMQDYNILTEALHNVAKHSNAAQVRIVAREHPGLYQLLIEDDGTAKTGLGRQGMRGMQEIGDHEGIGLKNMKERVDAYGGNLEIRSQNGWRIYITVPKKTER